MQQKRKKKWSKDTVLIFFLKNRAFLLVILFFIMLMLTTDTFLTGSNLMSLARQIAANGIIGVGYTFLLASDSVDLSAGYMMCMIGIISGLLSQTALPFPLILIICIAVGMFCSSMNAGLYWADSVFCLAYGSIYCDWADYFQPYPIRAECNCSGRQSGSSPGFRH